MTVQVHTLPPPIAPQAALGPGAVLDGKYRVEQLIAEGGMGVVVLATQLQLDRRVAIKYLRTTARDADGVLERFEREAKLAAKIRSEHVVRVHDVGVAPEIGPYMVMEYLEGESLGSLLGNGPLPIDQAVDFILQACDALAEVHALDIVHRDLKPDNMFLALRPPHATIVKLIDFGISKAAPKRGETGEWVNEALGTPSYMSPEQLEQGAAVDARSDIWSLGVVLYELLTGALPFDGANVVDLCTNILTQPPRPPSQLRPDIPPAINAALLRCFAKDPAERIGTVLELATILGPFGRVQYASDRVERVARVSAQSNARHARHAQTVLVSRKQRSWIPVALAAFAILALSGGALGIYAVRAAKKPPTTAAVPTAAITEAPVTSVIAPVASTPEPPALEMPANDPPPPVVAPRPATKRPSRPASRDPRAPFGERR